MMNSGCSGMLLILSTAAWSVETTSVFAGLLNPMWLSLIWTKRRPDSAFLLFLLPPKIWEVGMPSAAMVQRSPVPAQAMHLRNPRRSRPSLLWSWSRRLGSRSLCLRDMGLLFVDQWLS